MFEKPRTLNTGYFEKTDNFNVCMDNLHSLKIDHSLKNVNSI